AQVAAVPAGKDVPQMDHAVVAARGHYLAVRGECDTPNFPPVAGQPAPFVAAGRIPEDELSGAGDLREIGRRRREQLAVRAKGNGTYFSGSSRPPVPTDGFPLG